MKTNKTQKKKHSDMYDDSFTKPGSKGFGKKAKKRLSIYDDFNDEEDFSVKPSKR